MASEIRTMSATATLHEPALDEAKARRDQQGLGHLGSIRPYRDCIALTRAAEVPLEVCLDTLLWLITRDDPMIFVDLIVRMDTVASILDLLSYVDFSLALVICYAFVLCHCLDI